MLQSLYKFENATGLYLEGIRMVAEVWDPEYGMEEMIHIW